jgi:23S rRNA (guanosine2251-2'-O)-methyltransferase
LIHLTGFHAIEERIKAGAVRSVLLAAKAGPRARELIDLALAHKIRVERCGTHDLDRISSDHRGIILELEDEGPNTALTLETFLEGLAEKKDVLAVMLDDITDPHNFGAILRSCDQFAVDMVITRNKRNAKHADIIAKTSAGASSWVPCIELANLPRAAEQLKDAGFWIYGADMEGESAFKKDLRGRVCLIFGAEGTGIGRLLCENCDALVSIPSRGRVGSLNVSVAAGVLLYEARRQRAKG